MIRTKQRSGLNKFNRLHNYKVINVLDSTDLKSSESGPKDKEPMEKLRSSYNHHVIIQISDQCELLNLL